MIVHNFDPVLVDLYLIKIRWYSLAYIFGILGGWWYGKFLIKLQVQSQDQKNYLHSFDDLIGYIIIGIILGGRLGYVIFYNPIFYLNNFLEVFKIWNGGMSFHGGLIGVMFSTYIFSIKNKLNFKIFFDTISTVSPIGIFLEEYLILLIVNFMVSRQINLGVLFFQKLINYQDTLLKFMKLCWKV